MLLTVPEVGVADIFHALTVSQFDALSHEGTSAVITAEETTVPEHRTACASPRFNNLALLNQILYFHPSISIDDDW